MRVIIFWLLLQLRLLSASNSNAQEDCFQAIDTGIGLTMVNLEEQNFGHPDWLLTKVVVSWATGEFLYSSEVRQKSLMQLDEIKPAANVCSLEIQQGARNCDFRLVGLQNVLSNCYINASLQVLFHMAPLGKQLMHTLQNEHQPIPLIQYFWAYCSTEIESPFKHLSTFIKRYPEFTEAGGHDASEFLELFIQHTFPFCPEFDFSPIFYTQTQRIIRCKNGCENLKIENESLLYITIGMPFDKDEPIHLESAILDYFSSEPLPETYDFTCPNCECTKAIKRVTLVRGAEFVFVVLMRFENVIVENDKVYTVRRDNPVLIPQQLGEEVLGHSYHLHSIVNHDKDHYSSIIRHATTDSWYLFDDAKVSEFEFEQLNNTHPYLIVFARDL